MAEQAKPRISNITKYFVPGLVIGLTVGGIGGAYFSSSLDAPSMQPVKPKGQAATPPARAPARTEDVPASPDAKSPAPTGATGATAATGSVPAPK